MTSIFGPGDFNADGFMDVLARQSTDRDHRLISYWRMVLPVAGTRELGVAQCGIEIPNLGSRHSVPSGPADARLAQLRARSRDADAVDLQVAVVQPAGCANNWVAGVEAAIGDERELERSSGTPQSPPGGVEVLQRAGTFRGLHRRRNRPTPPRHRDAHRNLHLHNPSTHRRSLIARRCPQQRLGVSTGDEFELLPAPKIGSRSAGLNRLVGKARAAVLDDAWIMPLQVGSNECVDLRLQSNAATPAGSSAVLPFAGGRDLME
jgi:hypothetical protein